MNFENGGFGNSGTANITSGRALAGPAGPRGPRGPAGPAGPSAFLEWTDDIGDANVEWSTTDNSCIVSLSPITEERIIILNTEDVELGRSVYIIRKNTSEFPLHVIQPIFGRLDTMASPGATKFVFDGTKWHKW